MSSHGTRQLNRSAGRLRVLIAIAAAAALGLAGAARAQAPAQPQTPAPPQSPAQTPSPTQTLGPAQPKSPAAHKSHRKAAARPPVSAAAIAESQKTAGEATEAAPPPDPKQPADHDSSMTLKGGTEGTEFRSMTVQGEDRVHLDFDRPPVAVDLDPEKVAGLDLGSARDVLNRTVPDLVTPLATLSSKERSPYTARPWLRQFASGSVAQFRPEVKGSERWKLLIADSHGQTVASFDGRGEPPKELSWDGRSTTGSPVVPGLTYSYVLEAYDKAGNKRNFVGQGFTVSAYKFDTPAGPTLACSARGLRDPIVLEAASWWNQTNKPRDPIRVTVTSRSYEEANALAQRAAQTFAAHVLGDPSRVQAVAQVEADAPEGGVLRIGPATGESPAAPKATTTSSKQTSSTKSKKH